LDGVPLSPRAEIGDLPSGGVDPPLGDTARWFRSVAPFLMSRSQPFAFDYLRLPLFWGCILFFQAEAGIRVLYVTGVQTCALPICDFRHDRGPRSCRKSRCPGSSDTPCREARARRAAPACAARAPVDCPTWEAVRSRSGWDHHH